MYACAMVKSWSVYPVPFLGGDQSIHRDKNIEYPLNSPYIGWTSINHMLCFHPNTSV